MANNIKKSCYVALFLCAFLQLSARAYIKTDIWKYWNEYNSESVETIDHNAWQDFLDTYIVTSDKNINYIRYDDVSKSDKYQLRLYINALSRIRIKNYNQKEQLAFWINLYNALVVSTVLENYPLTSIKHVQLNPRKPKSGPWDGNIFKLSGTSLTLNDIAHRIIRPIFNEPRAVYAFCQSAISGPHLQTKAFTGNNLDELLEQSANQFINSKAGVKVIRGKVNISKLYVWYGKDFGGDDEAILKHIKEYSQSITLKNIKKPSDVKISKFLWTLNDGAILEME